MCSGREGKTAWRSPGPPVMVNPGDLAREFVGGHPVADVPVEVPETSPGSRQPVVAALEVRP